MKYGFIGTGNMGSALARAAAKSCPAEEIGLSNRTPSKAEALAKQLGCRSMSVKEVAGEAKYIFLGVKPQMMSGCLEEIKEILAGRKDRFLLVTMAAGMSMKKIAELAGGNYPVIRIMPNTPVSIGKGVILMCSSEQVAPDEKEEFKELLKEAGITDELDEALIDAGSAVSGCGPAFAYMFIEALADGAVQCGLPRAKALLYASAMLEGSAALAESCKKHPGELKDEVCSPGGSTIAGVHALELNGFRNALMDAVAAAYERTKELG